MGKRSKSDRTRARIAACALDLFERDGFEATTVDQVAQAAGVTPMTVFRHFTSKERLVLDDPYDAVIADAVGRQPRSLPPLVRTARALGQAWRQLSEPAGDQVRRRVRVVSSSEVLRAAAWRSNAATEQLIVDQLLRDGTPPLPARVAATATLAALMAALYEWAGQDRTTLGEAVAAALRTLDPGNG